MALNTVTSTSNAAAPAAAREVAARPATDDVSIVDRFTDSLSFDSVKNVASDVVEAGENLVNDQIKELKKVVDGFMGWMGLSMLKEMNKLEEKERERKANAKIEAAIEDGRRAANAAQMRNEDESRAKRRQAA